MIPSVCIAKEIMKKFQTQILGTLCTVHTSNYSCVESIWSELAIIEKKFSRFESQSLIGQLNEKGLCEYDDELVEMFTIAENLYIQSQSYFDIRVGTYLQKNGYGIPNFIQSNRQISEIKEKEYLFLDTIFCDREHTKIFLQEKFCLDFGGFGKGYALQKIAKKFPEEDLILDFGGDIYVGSTPRSVILQHPIENDVIVGELTLHNEFLCASSAQLRKWIHNGVEKNHMFVSSSSQLQGSFVKGKNGSICDAVATLLFLCDTSDFLKNFDVEVLLIK